VGQPVGVTDSFCYGFITSMGTELHMPDAAYKLLTTDIYGSTEATGILINLKGQMIGIIDTDNHNNNMKNMVCAIGISELKKMIENMSNNKDIAYLGIYGSDVTPEINREMGVPLGVYVKEMDMDSPAMKAGIQSGDVIIRVDDEPVETYKDFVTYLTTKSPEQEISIGLLRQGPDGYTGMKLEVILGIK